MRVNSLLPAVLFSVMVLATGSVGGEIPGGRSMDMRAADARYIRETNRLYALIRPESPQYGQCLVEIDPDRAEVLRTLPLPVAAYTLEPAADGQWLYAITGETPTAVYRIEVASLTIVARYVPRLTDTDPPERFPFYRLMALRGTADGYVAAFETGVAAFDGERRRKKVLSDPARPISQLIPTDKADLFYGFDELYSQWNVNRVRVTAEGLEYDGEPRNGLAGGFHRQLQYSEGLLYTANGVVSNVETYTQVGSYLADDSTISDTMGIDTVNRRAYFSARSGWGNTYLEFDLDTFLPIARLRLENGLTEKFKMPHQARRLLVTAGGDLVAFDGFESHLLLIPATSLVRYQPWTPPQLEYLGPGLRRLAIPASYLAADPAHRKLLATFQGRVPGAGNSVLTIDPESGQILSRHFAGSEPGRPAATESGDHVYVPLMAGGAVRRLRTADGVSDLSVPLRAVRWKGWILGPIMQPSQVFPLPGSEDAFAVIQAELPETMEPVFDAVVVYDGTTRRPDVVNRDNVIVDAGELSRDGNVLFGMGWYRRDGQFSRIRLTSQGATLERMPERIGRNAYEPMSCDDTLCATVRGTVINAEQGTRTSVLPAEGAVTVDKAAGRVYMLKDAGKKIQFIEYDADRARPIRAVTLPLAAPGYSLCRWSEGEFAALTDEGVILISADILKPVAPARPGPPVVSGAVTKLSLPATSIAYDAKRQLLYASVPGSNLAYDSRPAYTNSILAMDPSTGEVVKQLSPGSDPWNAQLTDDGQYLFTALTSAHAVARIDLDKWERDAVYPLGGSANVFTVRPGHSNMFFAALGRDPGSNVALLSVPGLRAYRDGVQMPEGTNSYPSWAVAADSDTILTSESRVKVTDNGLRVDTPYPDLFFYGPPRATSSGLLFGTGSISDIGKLRLIGQLDEHGPVLPDPDHRRIYYVRVDGIRAYDWDSLRVVAFLPFPFGSFSSTDLLQIVSCGENRAAVLINLTVYLVELSGKGWQTITGEKTIRPFDGGIRIPIRSAALLYDAGRKRLYVATPPEEGPLGNSVVALDPATGKVEDTLFAGTLPVAMTMPADGSRIHVALRGSRGLATVDPSSADPPVRRDFPSFLPRADYWPAGLAVVPGTRDVLAVSATNGSASDWLQTILEPDGKPRPKWVGELPFQRVLGDFLFFTPDATRLQGFDRHSMNAGGRWSLLAGPDGLEYARALSQGNEPTVAVCGGTVFTASGATYDAISLDALAPMRFPEATVVGIPDQAVACDTARDRLYYVRHFQEWRNGNTTEKTLLFTYQLSTRELLRTRDLPNRAGSITQMQAVGDAGIAYWISQRPYPVVLDLAPPTLEDELFIVHEP